eukprot:TRINITY_DN8255_c0_g1_i2.p1 TRINITY_DN8255_c0_g1~~TRINITY_DN8255_c0_g1_i2.p1  ORF type:complete len:2544 (+),score=1029.55 TRINITY_DN8255_c0_g1_i2:319-7950(+)
MGLFSKLKGAGGGGGESSSSSSSSGGGGNGSTIDKTIKDFHHAAYNGEIKKVEKMLSKRKVDINAIDEQGRTALIWAVWNEQYPTAMLLISFGANIHLCDEEGHSALHKAVVVKHKELVRLLLSKRANTELADADKRTPLHLAAYIGDANITVDLLKAGAKTAVLDKDGRTPIHYAVYRHQAELIKVFATYNADLDCKDSGNRTPLMYAAFQGAPKCLDALVARGANVAIVDDEGHDAAWYAKEGLRQAERQRTGKEGDENEMERAAAVRNLRECVRKTEQFAAEIERQNLERQQKEEEERLARQALEEEQERQRLAEQEKLAQEQRRQQEEQDRLNRQHHQTQHDANESGQGAFGDYFQDEVEDLEVETLEDTYETTHQMATPTPIYHDRSAQNTHHRNKQHTPTSQNNRNNTNKGLAAHRTPARKNPPASAGQSTPDSGKVEAFVVSPSPEGKENGRYAQGMDERMANRNSNQNVASMRHESDNQKDQTQFYKKTTLPQSDSEEEDDDEMDMLLDEVLDDNSSLFRKNAKQEDKKPATQTTQRQTQNAGAQSVSSEAYKVAIQQLNRERNTVKNLEALISSMEKEMDKRDRKSPNKREMSLKAENDLLNQQLTDLKQQLADHNDPELNEYIESLEDESETLKQETHRLQDQVTALEKERDEVVAASKRLEIEFNELQIKYQEVDKALTLSQISGDKSDSSEMIAKMRDQIEIMKIEKGKLMSEAQAHPQDQAAIQTLKHDLVESQKDKERINHLLEASRTEIAELRNELLEMHRKHANEQSSSLGMSTGVQIAEPDHGSSGELSSSMARTGDIDTRAQFMLRKEKDEHGLTQLTLKEKESELASCKLDLADFKDKCNRLDTDYRRAIMDKESIQSELSREKRGHSETLKELETLREELFTARQEANKFRADVSKVRESMSDAEMKFRGEMHDKNLEIQRLKADGEINASQLELTRNERNKLRMEAAKLSERIRDLETMGSKHEQLKKEAHEQSLELREIQVSQEGMYLRMTKARDELEEYKATYATKKSKFKAVTAKYKMAAAVLKKQMSQQRDMFQEAFESWQQRIDALLIELQQKESMLKEAKAREQMASLNGTNTDDGQSAVVDHMLGSLRELSKDIQRTGNAMGQDVSRQNKQLVQNQKQDEYGLGASTSSSSTYPGETLVDSWLNNHPALTSSSSSKLTSGNHGQSSTNQELNSIVDRLRSDFETERRSLELERRNLDTQLRAMERERDSLSMRLQEEQSRANQLQRVQDRAVNSTTNHEKSLETIRKLTAQLAEAQKERSDARIQAQNLEFELEEANRSIQQHQMFSGQHENERRMHEKTQEKLEKLREENANLLVQVATLEQQLETKAGLLDMDKERARQSTSRVQNELEDKQAEIRRLNDQLAQVEQQKSLVQQQHEQEIQRIKDTLNQEIDTLKEQQIKERQGMHAHHENQMSTFRQQMDNHREGMSQEHEDRLNRMEAEHEAELQRKQQAHEHEIHMKDTKFDNELSQLKGQHDNQVQALTNQVEELQEKLSGLETENAQLKEIVDHDQQTHKRAREIMKQDNEDTQVMLAQVHSNLADTKKHVMNVAVQRSEGDAGESSAASVEALTGKFGDFEGETKRLAQELAKWKQVARDLERLYGVQVDAQNGVVPANQQMRPGATYLASSSDEGANEATNSNESNEMLRDMCERWKGKAQQAQSNQEALFAELELERTVRAQIETSLRKLDREMEKTMGSPSNLPTLAKHLRTLTENHEVNKSLLTADADQVESVVADTQNKVSMLQNLKKRNDELFEDKKKLNAALARTQQLLDREHTMLRKAKESFMQDNEGLTRQLAQERERSLNLSNRLEAQSQQSEREIEKLQAQLETLAGVVHESTTPGQIDDERQQRRQAESELEQARQVEKQLREEFAGFQSMMQQSLEKVVVDIEDLKSPESDENPANALDLVEQQLRQVLQKSRVSFEAQPGDENYNNTVSMMQIRMQELQQELKAQQQLSELSEMEYESNVSNLQSMIGLLGNEYEQGQRQQKSSGSDNLSYVASFAVVSAMSNTNGSPRATPLRNASTPKSSKKPSSSKQLAMSPMEQKIFAARGQSSSSSAMNSPELQSPGVENENWDTVESDNFLNMSQPTFDTDSDGQGGKESGELHGAVKKLDVEQVNAVLRQGKELVDNVNEQGRTALHVCCAMKTQDDRKVEVCRLLLRAGASVHQQDQDGNYPLHLAAASGSGDVVKLLLDQPNILVEGANFAIETALHRACQQGHFGAVSALINRGRADVEARTLDGVQALHLAAGEGQVECVSLLLQKGADPNCLDELREVPLHKAAIGGHYSVCVQLINGACDVNASNADGNTALHLAVLHGSSLKCVQILADGGCDMESRNHDGDTVLHVACSQGIGEIVEYAVMKMSNLNIKNTHEQTALHLAAARPSVVCVQHLLRRANRCDVNAQDIESQTALHLAVIANSNEVVAELLSNNASVNKVNIRDQTALQLGTELGHTSCVNQILQFAQMVEEDDDRSSVFSGSFRSSIRGSETSGHYSDDSFVDLDESEFF